MRQCHWCFWPEGTCETCRLQRSTTGDRTQASRDADWCRAVRRAFVVNMAHKSIHQPKEPDNG